MFGSLYVRLFQDPHTIETLVPRWDELLSEFDGATVFSTWGWLGAWWRAFGGSQRLLILGFFDQSERLVGLAPLMQETRPLYGGLQLRILRLLGDGSGDSDNLDLPVRRGYESAFVTSLLEWLQNQSDEWDVCELNTLPADSPALPRLQMRARALGWNLFQCERPRLIVHLPQSWDAYLNQLSSEDRHNLPRYARRLQRRYRVLFHKCRAQAELPGALETLFQLHQMRWRARGEPGTFCSRARRSFYRQMSRELLAKGFLEFWSLSLDGEPAAAQFAMRYGDTVFQLQEGFDPRHSGDRVGYVLRGHILQQLIAGGVRHYDFLGGRAAHKSRWYAQERSYITIRLARHYSLATMYASWAHHSDAGKERLRMCLPSRAWLALHRINSRFNKAEDEYTSSSPDGNARVYRGRSLP
jgi:CelD/BcsL family acetyltransferase involved in cellulose biosynthesis